MKRIFSFLISMILGMPALAGAADQFSAMLAQVPAPPASLAAAEARYQDGHSENGSEMGFDKSSSKLLVQIADLEKKQMASGTKYGGDTAEDMQAKMANMSQDEKVAYA